MPTLYKLNYEKNLKGFSLCQAHKRKRQVPQKVSHEWGENPSEGEFTIQDF